MPQDALKGQTVMIATPKHHALSLPVKDKLGRQGAKVVYTKVWPDSPEKISAVGAEIEKHTPPINALIILNPDLELASDKSVVIELTKRLKGALPVVVCEASKQTTDIQPFLDVGAQYLNFNGNDGFNTLTSGVAEAIAQHGKTTATPSGDGFSGRITDEIVKRAHQNGGNII